MSAPWQTAEWLDLRMGSVRDQQVALAALKRRSARNLVTHFQEQLSWPITLLEREIYERQGDISEACAPWFEEVATGPYAVHSIGAAGVWRTEFSGFHYPYQALAKEQELAAAAAPHYLVAYRSVNTDDAEADVEREDEAYWVEPLRLCEADNDRICERGCGAFDCIAAVERGVPA